MQITEKPKLKSEFIFVTPEMAREWLSKNKNNRSMRRHRVTKIRDDLRNGRFYTTHQGIAFNCNGDLKDGQHRLTAIAEEGIGAWIMVTTGLPSQAVVYLDRGGIRQVHDNARLAGFDVTKNDISIGYVAMNAPMSVAHSSSTSESVVVDFVEQRKDAFLAVRHTGNKKKLSKASVLAAFVRAFPYCPTSAWNRCFKLFMNGIDDDFDPIKERAIIVFRDFCLTGGYRNTYSDRIDLYRRAQRAIKAFMNAEELKIVKPTEQDLFPLINESNAI
jgi:hypothetical protein